MEKATNLTESDALAVAVTEAIHNGDIPALQEMLTANPGLAAARIVDGKGVSRTLVHVAADWPGHFPNGPQTVATLAAAGADLNAAVLGVSFHSETALHWAASSDDVDLLDALLDAGADIEAQGAVFTGGTAMSDAVIFAQWRAARRLLERDARTTLSQAAALGLLDRVQAFATGQPSPSRDELTNALWHACRGGQLAVAQHLVEYGADLNWVGHDHMTPLDAAARSGETGLIEWLLAQGARHA